MKHLKHWRETMGIIKGQLEYVKFGKGVRLTRKQAMLAKCYECNGFEESGVYCGGKKCPLIQYQPHKSKIIKEQ